MTDYNPNHFKPGDLAMIVPVDPDLDPTIAMRGTTPLWRSRSMNFGDPHVRSARRLLLLDPEDQEQMCALIRAVRSNGYVADRSGGNVRGAVLSMLKPPRIEEPGTWGVVEASSASSLGTRRNWVRHPDGEWRSAGSTVGWGGLIDPVLVREGIA